jgi:dihydrofolate reductase
MTCLKARRAAFSLPTADLEVSNDDEPPEVEHEMWLDGYIAAPEQSAENPVRDRRHAAPRVALPAPGLPRAAGEEGGEDNASTPIVEGWFEDIGATVMGRNMFGGGPGPWGPDPWTGFWGDEPPYHHPVFVLTHHAREPLEMQGGTTFHFVTDGIESALEQAKAAAAGKDVSLGGGATIVQQYVVAGLLDEMLISFVPVFLGGGAGLFDNLGDARPKLEQVQVVGAPGVTHIRYRLTTEEK